FLPYTTLFRSNTFSDLNCSFLYSYMYFIVVYHMRIISGPVSRVLWITRRGALHGAHRLEGFFRRCHDFMAPQNNAEIKQEKPALLNATARRIALCPASAIQVDAGVRGPRQNSPVGAATPGRTPTW